MRFPFRLFPFEVFNSVVPVLPEILTEAIFASLADPLATTSRKSVRRIAAFSGEISPSFHTSLLDSSSNKIA